MLARDLAPDRLRHAQAEVAALASAATGSRMGLVLFAGSARTAVPLTEDLRSLAGVAAAADPGSVPRGGSDLGAALREALRLLDGPTGPPKVVVLLTDGEDLGRDADAAAEECRRRGVVVHALGVGSETGGKIAVPGERGEEFLRDETGREVLSRLDAGGLARLARRTGGEFRRAERSPGALERLHAQRIRPAARRAAEAAGQSLREDRSQWPLLAALLLWTLDLRLAGRRR
jgi:Ca-activated chloride channel family protein